MLLGLVAVSAALCVRPVFARQPHDSGRPQPVSDEGTTIRLARALRSDGDPLAAVQIYRKVLARKGAADDLYLEMAFTMLDAGLVDDAIGVFAAIPPNAPDAAAAQFGLARAQMAMNQPGKAVEYVDRAAAMAPGNLAILVGRGVALDEVGRHVEAQASYRAALVIAPRSIAARSDLALSLALVGQYAQALEILIPIARSAGATARDRQNLAFIYGMQGDSKAALALGRADLDEHAVQANATFFALAGKPGR